LSFEYRQSTGQFTGSQFAAQGYSGKWEGLNRPSLQSVKDIGPIPQGIYTIQRPQEDAKVGRVAMRLIPDPTNEMFGRGDFLIHGPHPNDNHDSSEGCIILPYEARLVIGAAVLEGNNQLSVVA
jgi:hypothetical protein